MLQLFVNTPKKYFHPEKLNSGELAVVRVSPANYKEYEGQLVIRVYDQLWSLGTPPGVLDRYWEISKMPTTWAVRYLERGECIQVCNNR